MAKLPQVCFTVKNVLRCQHIDLLCHLLVYFASGFGGHACSKCMSHLEIVLCCKYVGWLFHMLVHQTVLDQAARNLAGMLVCMIDVKTALLCMRVCPLHSQQAACHDFAYILMREQRAC